MNVTVKYAILACIALLVSACSSSKNANTYTKADQTTTTTTQSSSYTISPSHWQQLKMPMSVNIESPKSISISGNVEMVRGTSILLSLRFFGMEVGCLYATQDSVIVLDKINKRYVAESLNGLLADMPITISNVQDLLIGHPFVLGKIELSDDATTDFETTAFDNGWLLVPKSMPTSVNYGFTLNNAFDLLAIVVQSGSYNPVTCVYGSAVTTNAGKFSESASVNAITGKTTIDATLKWNYGKAKWDDEVSPRSVTIPHNYSRIKVADLPKILSSLSL